MSNFSEDKYYRCIDGKSRKKGIIGYCHNKTHLGCVTVKLMKEHKCLEKSCTYFAKYTNLAYWVQNENKKEKKSILLCKKKKKEELCKERERIIRDATNDINNFKIKNIEVQNNIVIINYYSSDKIDLDKAKAILKDKLKMKFEFRRINLNNKVSSKIIYPDNPEKQVLSKKERKRNQYKEILKHTIENQHEILTSDKCGCCCCLEIFDASEVTEYIKKRNTLFLTAVCPKCANSALLPESPDYELNKDLLNELKIYSCC